MTVGTFSCILITKLMYFAVIGFKVGFGKLLVTFTALAVNFAHELILVHIGDIMRGVA